MYKHSEYLQQFLEKYEAELPTIIDEVECAKRENITPASAQELINKLTKYVDMLARIDGMKNSIRIEQKYESCEHDYVWVSDGCTSSGGNDKCQKCGHKTNYINGR